VVAKMEIDEGTGMVFGKFLKMEMDADVNCSCSEQALKFLATIWSQKRRAVSSWIFHLQNHQMDLGWAIGDEQRVCHGGRSTDYG
jgi:hypothetical protein